MIGDFFLNTFGVFTSTSYFYIEIIVDKILAPNLLTDTDDSLETMQSMLEPDSQILSGLQFILYYCYY